MGYRLPQAYLQAFVGIACNSGDECETFYLFLAIQKREYLQRCVLRRRLAPAEDSPSSCWAGPVEAGELPLGRVFVCFGYG